MCIGEANKSIGKAVQVSSATWCLNRLFLSSEWGDRMSTYTGETDPIGALMLIGGVIGSILFWRKIHIPDIIYSRERTAIIRMDELRKDYDSVQDLETLADMVEKNPDIEVYMYCNYSDFAGGSNKEVRFPIKPNSRIIKLLCEEEKKRLLSDMGRTKKVFNLPWHK